jgi:hypothetical protein
MEKGQNNPTLERIEEFPQEMIKRLEPLQVDPMGRGRPRVLPALCLWGGVIICVLRGWNSQLAIWRLLKDKGLWNYPRFPISDQAVYKRLEQGGVEPLKQLFGLVSQALEEHLAPYIQSLASFATEVVAIDATTLDQVLRQLPVLRAVPKGGRIHCCPASWQECMIFALSSGVTWSIWRTRMATTKPLPAPCWSISSGEP